jgi:hypothetical protein
LANITPNFTLPPLPRPDLDLRVRSLAGDRSRYVEERGNPGLWRPTGLGSHRQLGEWLVRKSWLQLYAPFLVLALVQALLIVVAPSRGESGTGLAAGDALQGAEVDLDGDGVPDSGTDLGEALTDAGLADGGTDGGGAGGSGGTTGGTGGTTGGTGGAAAGDTSHCKDGKQVGGLRVAPPCKPKFSGNNGGATYQGVTDKEIKIVFFSSEPNEQVDTILASQGLAVPEEQLMDAVGQFVKFINENYELYGRKLVVKRVVGDCPTTPPDYDKCIAAAQKVVKEKPFAVIWATSLYATVYDVWSRAGIVSLGGSSFDSSFYTRGRPFRYDLGMDGTKSADQIAEYYCKKMARKPADHAGNTIHPTIGGKKTRRHLAIITPNIKANILTGERVRAKVDACNGADPPPVLRDYASNIETATQQTQATVSALIAAKATTVVCMCDPIAPVFATKGMTANGYFPEILLPGLGLLDYDLLGRLYDTEQMKHAFGPSNLPVLTSLDDTDQARVWRATGRSGHPCGDNGCGIPWAYFNFLGIGLGQAGPQLTPLTFERGLLQDLPDIYGGPETSYIAFGPNDYTGYEDGKEVYWDANARSRVDGKAGAFVPLNGGKRYRPGQWPGGLNGIPARP